MQHDESGAPLRRPQAVGNAECAVQTQAGGLKTDHLFFHDARELISSMSSL